MDVDYGGAVKAYCVPWEYMFVGFQRCSCGAAFITPPANKKCVQHLRKSEGKYYDVIEITCVKCGNKKEFVFDINGFFLLPVEEKNARTEEYKRVRQEFFEIVGMPEEETKRRRLSEFRGKYPWFFEK
ncbi:MAG: hypothetical protein ABH834_07890 [Candidatus Altiarchaeota archaeon]